MITIRPYEEKDEKAVESICIKTAPPSFVDTPKHIEKNLLLYCRYYTRMKKHSFVAVNENDEAVGYIFCEPDYNTYKKEYGRVELKQLLRLGISAALQGRGGVLAVGHYAGNYPAHLHIDILPEYQRMGVGHMLVDALCKHLTAEGVKGVHLCCGAKNEMGVSFYRKYGFREIDSNPGAIVFALDLK